MTDLDDVVRSLQFRHARDIAALRRRATEDPWDGRAPLMPTHRLVVPSWDERDRNRADLAVSMLFTFDQGPHASGWWRNSDYDRCFHLSFTGMARVPGRGYQEYADVPEIDRRAWPRVFFPSTYDMAWWEPPAADADAYRNAPASKTTWHVRLFIDRATGRPIIPEGEVYTLKPWAEGDSPEKVYR